MANTKREVEGKGGEKPVCGLIMPISATANHSAEHWAKIQTLMHRAITTAGFAPLNVWESTAKDRISERIIGNIFQVPIAVADISDLNPNVMLELGLRLSSKKPTVVVVNDGGEIPFDIRDFHAVFYPQDMNMLAMEDFFRRVSKILQEKHQAFSQERYTPFLSSVIVDVASPETREVGANELLLSRLDEISGRLSSLETASRKPRGASAAWTGSSNQSSASGVIDVEIPVSQVEDFKEDASNSFFVDEMENGVTYEGLTTIKVHYSGAPNYAVMSDYLTKVAKKHGGDLGIPF